MDWSTAENAVTRWSCSTRAQPAISVTIYAAQYGVPVCQYIPADAVDEHVVNAFFEALSEVELDAYTQAVKAQQQTDDTLLSSASSATRTLTLSSSAGKRGSLIGLTQTTD